MVVKIANLLSKIFILFWIEAINSLFLIKIASDKNLLYLKSSFFHLCAVAISDAMWSWAYFSFLCFRLKGPWASFSFLCFRLKGKGLNWFWVKDKQLSVAVRDNYSIALGWNLYTAKHTIERVRLTSSTWVWFYWLGQGQIVLWPGCIIRRFLG